jgi:hypothetical protein
MNIDKGLAVVIGMSLAYFVSFLGLILAWIAYRRHHHHPVRKEKE